MSKAKYTIEIPCYSKMSGGITRMITLAQYLYTVELGRLNEEGGGTNHMCNVVNKLPQSHLRIQRKTGEFRKIKLSVPYSVGLPDETFPKSEYVITYSDNPHLQKLTKLPQVKKIGILMLSYGMCFERERPNVHTQGIKVMCSTSKIQKSIESEGIKVYNVGFGLDIDNFFIDKTIERKRYAAIMYHSSPLKRYDAAVNIVDRLCDANLIDGVVSFGNDREREQHRHPKKLVYFYPNASFDEVRKVFNESTVYIMPSASEGLNLTPIEAMFCGCPSVICDGAWGDLYFDNETCLQAKIDDENDIYEKSVEIINNYEYYSTTFNKIRDIAKNFTWQKTVNNIIRTMTQ